MSAGHAGESTYHYLCIGCPLGCRLELDESQGEIVEVRGNSCKKGEEFARQEHHDPRRLVTTTVAIEGARWPRVPVKTSASVPKALVRELSAALMGVQVHAPIAAGDIIVADVLGTGVDVVATRSMPAV
ncbi:MAG: DUF1667 domain-containing protein [Acidimicrobiaceae bacterium]|nr:DUF1667 domain-containing protein [Acidimicrobiaceae bacterium]